MRLLDEGEGGLGMGGSWRTSIEARDLKAALAYAVIWVE